MKKLMVIFAILFFVVKDSQAQDNTQKSKPDSAFYTQKKPAPVKFSKEYYEMKSQKLKTASWILLSAGTVLGVTGVIVLNNQKEYDLEHMDQAIMSEAGADFLIIAGASMVVTSIPMFITAGKYKRKALEMSANLKFESRQDLYQASVSMKYYPAVGVRISF